MSLLIGFLTFILVLNCLLLILLVLVQLPKKEAGAGLAFGAGAVDTLIGAGSGNALTQLTKYSATAFLGLAVVIAILNSHRTESSSRGIDEALSQKSSAAPVLNIPQQPPSAGSLTPPANPPASGPLELQPKSVTPPAQTPAQTPAAGTTSPAQTPAPEAAAPVQPETAAPGKAE